MCNKKNVDILYLTSVHGMLLVLTFIRYVYTLKVKRLKSQICIVVNNVNIDIIPIEKQTFHVYIYLDHRKLTM